MRLALGAEQTQPTAEAQGEVRSGSSTIVGPYTIVRSLGEGGMGEVFLAEQHEPIRRQVALKVIKQGMDTRRVVARFEAERQALAMMDHPAIARVFDAGATDEGRPYFAMEYVAGEPISDYCDRERLSIEARLTLMARVCAGVQHAHQKGVIHRDLKPSNLLVVEQDGRAMPKIIDFGISKAIGGHDVEQTLFTEMGVIVGTLEYMSPEQADLSAIGVDTRTDVYSLGVILYELLAGVLPFDRRTLARAGIEEVRRMIREEEPSSPSARVTAPGERTRETARGRGTDPARLRRELQGDLDWITLKALAKEPARRYESPLELAADIERYLSSRPVVARPPSLPYLARKFVRRHWVAVIVAGALVSALGVTLFQAQRGRLIAERARDESESVSRFLADILQLADPNRSGGELTVTQAIDRAAPSIDRRFEDRPLVRARLLYVLGEVYTRLSHYDEALDALERSLALRIDQLGEDHALTAQTHNMLGVLHKEQGDYERAEEAYERALAGRRVSLGPQHPLTAETLNNLAVIYQSLDRLDEAKTYLEQALEIRKRELGPQHEMVGRTLSNIGALHFRRDQYEEALDYFRQALAVQEAALGQDHPALSHTLSNLGVAYGAIGDTDGAIGVLERALAVREKAFGPEHPDVAATLLGLGVEYQEAGRLQQAQSSFRRAIAICEPKLGPDHRRTQTGRLYLAIALEADGDPEGAIPLLESVADARQRQSGADDPSLMEPLYYLAVSLQATGDERRARETIERAIAIGASALDADDPDLAMCRELLASFDGPG